MSDTPAAPDWWQASDGKWYPPEQHPNYRPPASDTPPSEWAPPPPPSAWAQPGYGDPQYSQPPPGYGPPPADAQYQQTYQQPYQQASPPYSQYSPYGGYGAYATLPQTSSKATGALVTSILSFVICPFVLAVVGLILAGQAAKEIRASGGRQTGEGLVTASRIIAIANIALSVLAVGGFILAIIAIPTETSSSNGSFFESGQDESAQSDLRNALSAEKVFYTDQERYTDDVLILQQIEPSVAYDRGVFPNGPGRVVVSVTGREVALATQSTSGECFYIRDNVDETLYARDHSCGPSDEQLYTGSW